MDKVAERLKELRMSQNMSQTQFGTLLGVSQDTISLWEKGKSYPRVEDVLVICRTFEVASDYLLGLREYE